MMRLYGGHFSDSTSLCQSVPVELPTVTKFLLIASYLASYNPVSLDRHFFMKSKDTSRSKRRKTDGTSRGKEKCLPMRQQLLGPKSFPLERLLAIFHVITEDRIENSVDLDFQVRFIDSA